MGATGDRLDRLYMRASEGTAGTAGEKPILLQTSDGERLALAPTGKEKWPSSLPGDGSSSPWTTSCGSPAWPSRPATASCSATAPGCSATLMPSPAAGDAELRPIGRAPLDMHELRGPHEAESEDAARPGNGTAASPTVELFGENMLIGGINLPALHIVTAGQTIAVPPGQIRKLRAGEPDPPPRKWPSRSSCGTAESLSASWPKARCRSAAATVPRRCPLTTWSKSTYPRPICRTPCERRSPI